MAHSPLGKAITRLPKHIAIVPDGNRRWAERRRLSHLEGHRAGAENMLRIVDHLKAYPIKYVTMYGFSTENWNRDKEEVSNILGLLGEYIEKSVPRLNELNVRFRHLGRLEDLSPELQKSMNRAVELTSHNSRMTLSLAFNYGGRAEIVAAVRRMIADGINEEAVSEELVAAYLYMPDLPDVDLLIRTGDEVRLSNFLIWQTAYSEYHFTKVLWPDFTKRDIERALVSYNQRVRRFGGS